MPTFVDIAIDAALVTSCCAYAAWLEEHKKLEPDWTWVEVGIGTVLCLTAAHLHSRQHGGDWQSGERRVWHAFSIGAPPIIIGELRQWLKRREERHRYAMLRQ